MSVQNGFWVINGFLLKYNGNGKDIHIPTGVTTIEDRAFLCCGNLNSVTIGNGVLYIGEEIFLGCTHLNAVVISDSVIFIEDNAFDGCGTISIYGKCGSYAEFFAKEHNIFFVAE